MEKNCLQEDDDGKNKGLQKMISHSPPPPEK